MIKSTEMKKSREILVEKLSSELSQRSFKLLEKTVNGGFLEFCENGKIKIDEETSEEMEKVADEIVDREKLSWAKTPDFCDEVCDLASKKLEKLLEADGWKMNDEGEYLAPLEAARQSE